MKILISLTPVNLRPHIKIIHDETLPVKDDLNLLFKNYFEENFFLEEKKFTEILEEELKYSSPPIGKKIKEIKENENRNLEVYFSDIKNDKAKDLTLFLQLILPFFIEGANTINIEEYFWHYFIIYEKTKENFYKVIGFCTLNHFHLDLYKYRSMISQFMILPNHQRKGLGLLLLEVRNKIKILFFFN